MKSEEIQITPKALPGAFTAVWSTQDHGIWLDDLSIGLPSSPIDIPNYLFILKVFANSHGSLCFMPSVSCHALVVLVHKLECNMLMSNSILLECKDLPISLIYPALKLIQNSLTSKVLEAKCSL